MKKLSERNKYLVFGIALIIFALFIHNPFNINMIIKMGFHFTYILFLISLIPGIILLMKGVRIKKGPSTEELDQPELAKKELKAEKGSSSNPQDKALAVNCPSCKAQNTPENSFCTSCGAKL